MTSQLKHCEDGQTLKEFLLSGHPVGYDSIQSQTYKESLETTQHSPHKRPRSAILKSVRSIKEVTSNDRLQISNSTTQNTKSSATLAQGSTRNAGVCCPSGTNTCRRNRRSGGYLKGLSLIICLLWFIVFILLTFLLGPIVPFWIWACEMDLWEKWNSARGTQYRH